MISCQRDVLGRARLALDAVATTVDDGERGKRELGGERTRKERESVMKQRETKSSPSPPPP